MHIILSPSKGQNKNTNIIKIIIKMVDLNETFIFFIETIYIIDQNHCTMIESEKKYST